MHTTHVGTDISKATFDAARLGAGGCYKHKRFGNDPAGFAAFLVWLDEFGGERPLVCMEATGACSLPLAECLHARGWPVCVVNPACTAAFAKTELGRAKTDKADAKLIARFAREKQPPLWRPLPPNLRTLQSLLRRIEDLLEMIQMERNRLDTADADAAPSVRAVAKALEGELEAVRQRIRRHIDGDPDLRGRRDLLQSIPGIGEASAAHLPAAIRTTASPPPSRPRPAPGWTCASATRASTPGRGTSPSAATRCCARPSTCPPSSPGSTTPPSRPFASASRPRARTAKPSPAPRCDAKTPPPRLRHPQIRQALRPEFRACIRGGKTVSTALLKL